MTSYGDEAIAQSDGFGRITTQHLPNNNGTLALLEDIAPEFVFANSYGVGELCISYDADAHHLGYWLYRCIAATDGTTWPEIDSTHWALATVEDVLAALRTGKLDATKRNLLDYTSGTTLAPATAVYRSSLNADGTFPTITDSGIPTAAAYYQFELELSVPSTVPSTITGPSGWTFLDGHGLPDPADLVGGETIYISVRLDCTARTFLASVWRVA